MYSKINIIVAIDNDMGIGKEGTLPWDIPEDLKYFRKTTCYEPSAVIMGRKTWESIKPLKKRLNIIISSTLKEVENALVFNNLIDAINYAVDEGLKIFVIGGEMLYTEAVKFASTIYLTRIYNSYDCDRFFPKFEIPLLYTSSIKSHNGTNYQYMLYSTENNQICMFEPEYNNHDKEYLKLVNNVLTNGSERSNRTGINTISMFGTQSRYDLSKGIPILTTKRMRVKSVIEELLWFMRGETDNSILQSKGVNIWTGNSTKEFLTSRGLPYDEGDLGPVYGFAMRHFGANYTNCKEDYSGKGVDQISEIIRLIKDDPNSRRILMNLWDPTTLDKVALPPCHLLYQFYVNDGKLSCSMYQRSGDVGLGVPFNIMSSSIMVHIFANICDLEVGEFIHTIGDAHIYVNHISALERQLESPIYGYAKLEIKKKVEDPSELSYEDFSIIGYHPGPRINMKMAV